MSQISNNFKYQTELAKYTEEQLVTILSQYGRNLKNVVQDIDIIRQWLKTQRHILVETSDKEILYFLISSKFSLEKTKEKLNMYYCIRDILPEIYKNRKGSSKEVETITKIVDVVVLPELSKDLNRVTILRATNNKSTGFDANSVNACAALLMDSQPLLDICNSNEFIAELSNLPFELIMKYTIMDFKKLLLIGEKVYSMRVAKIHIINMPKYCKTFLALAKSVLKPKIIERIIVHDSYETLHEYFPKSMLPSDFGGETSSMEELKRNLANSFTKYDYHYEKLNVKAVDTNLIPESLQNDEMLGYHGSFRKLQVD